VKVLLGYRRKSMVRDRADLISPERQTRACELWVEMHGDEYIIEWYEDVEGHRSGRWEKTRPGWRDLLSQLNRPDVEGIISDTLDRVYRNVKEFGEFLDRIKAAGKKLILVKQSIDTDTAIGQAITMFMMVVYQLESDQTSERMTRNIRYKREELGRHWGPTPFGCDRNEDGQLIPTTKTYWLNPSTGEALPPLPLGEGRGEGWEERRFHDSLLAAAQLYAEGIHSLDDVAAMVNAAGWRYAAEAKGYQPRLFTRDDIRRMVSFWQLYKGDLPLGNITNTKNAPVLPGGHHPILPIELCEKIGMVKSKRGQQRGHRAKEDRLYLLGELLHCAVCGQQLNGYFQNGRRYYRHRHAKRDCLERWTEADKIETEVLNSLASLCQNDFLAEISAEAERLARAAFAQQDTAQPILAELDKWKEKLARLEDLYLDGDINKPRYLARKAEIDQHIGDLEDRLYAITETINFNQVLHRITSALAQLNQATPETKKTLILTIFQRLDAAGGQIIHSISRPWAKPFF
jgi:DNA invertase Pin-like site-specific DNA recombinase